ncbi:DUF6988 family protein [Shewanella frigidimarina]|uniref:DUF6988 family protein n=1 Tax=Shewanella frigidimarina TaxID=56812 RepID=UPI003F9F0920
MECIFKLRDQLKIIWQESEKCSVKGTNENRFISAMLFVSLNHCDAIQLLIQKRNFASSYALLRPLLETTYRSVWLNRCASKEQINKCIDKDKWKSTWDLVQAIEVYSGNAPILSKVWEELRPLMHSYAHGGNQNAFRQLGDGNYITPNIDDTEVVQLIQVVALMSFVVLAELIDLSENTESLVLEKMSESMQQWALKKPIRN